MSAAPLPAYCRLAAYEGLQEALPQLETAEGLERATIAVAMHELHDISIDSVGARLDALARRVEARGRGASLRARIAHLHDELFEDLKLRGNAENYYISENSYLPWVLTNARGIPISLTLVVKCVGYRVGIEVEGINAPGHFLASIHEEDGTQMLWDPFSKGRVLTRGEAAELVSQMVGRQLAPDSRTLAVATHAQWLRRMLANLQNVFVNQAREADARAMLELAGLLKTLED